ncbi:aldolase/citrate lyase family protein [Halioxenophilus aromaticivorans]|uniref:HpcH/HpaI aldolase/citrate lyase domain-containing protein n=1 Tax=Halioxenophilus aromaticivorans TaxID=1306992 RepID=A0AAV3U5D3_9ALTE
MNDDASNSDFGDNFVLTMITNCPTEARRGVLAGINRIGVDLEKIGKAQRQSGLNSRVSSHDLNDLEDIRRAIDHHPLFVRVNSMHAGSEFEINAALDIGATHIMLPYFHRPQEVKDFSRLVNGRATTILLVETAAAIFYIEDLVKISGIDEIHIGLTDLKISLNIPSRFETLTHWIAEHVSKVVNGAGLPFHVGGVTCIDDQRLPIPGWRVASQYPRLNATGALVTRAFLEAANSDSKLITEVDTFRRFLNECASSSAKSWEQERSSLKTFIRQELAQGKVLP